MSFVDKQEFNRNIYEFNNGGKDYIFLVNKTQIFPCDEESKELFNNIKTYPEDKVPFDYLINKSKKEKNELKQWLVELTNAIGKEPQEKETRVDIKGFSLITTKKCNLNCYYCFQKQSSCSKQKEASKSLSIENVKQALKLFVKNKKDFAVEFFGGEALIEWDLVKETVKHAKEMYPNTNFQFSIFTNGTLLSDEIIKFFKEYNFKVTISVDGPQEYRDKIQGPSSKTAYKNIENQIKKITHAIDSKKLFSYSVITPFNNNIDVLINYFKELGFKNILLAPMTSPIKEEHHQSLDSWVQNFENYFSKAENKEKIKYLGNIQTYWEQIKNQETHSHFCNAAHTTISINENGEITPCHRFSDDKNFKLGNTKEGLNVNESLTFAKDKTSNTDNSACLNCFARNLCAGGCKARNYLQNQNLTQPDKNYCKIIQSNLKLALENYILN